MGLEWFKNRILLVLAMLGVDVRKLRRDSLQGKMNAQQLKFEHGLIVGQRQNAKKDKQHQVKLLKISLSDDTMFQDPALVTGLTLLVDRYKPRTNRKNKLGDKRNGGYKHEWSPADNGRVNRIPISGRGGNVVDLKAEYYFDTTSFQPMGMGYRHRKFPSSYVHLGFRLEYIIRGKKYTTGIIGKIQLMAIIYGGGTSSVITYQHQR